MPDLIKLDRDALLDLIKAIEILSSVIQTKAPYLSNEEMDRIMYVNKLVITATDNYNINNPL